MLVTGVRLLAMLDLFRRGLGFGTVTVSMSMPVPVPVTAVDDLELALLMVLILPLALEGDLMESSAPDDESTASSKVSESSPAMIVAAEIRAFVVEIPALV